MLTWQVGQVDGGSEGAVPVGQAAGLLERQHRQRGHRPAGHRQRQQVAQGPAGVGRQVARVQVRNKQLRDKRANEGGEGEGSKRGSRTATRRDNPGKARLRDSDDGDCSVTSMAP
jgi:hypothetical protein